MNRHYLIDICFHKEENFVFFLLESNHIKFMTYQLVKRKEFPSLLIRNIATTNIKIKEVIPTL